MTPTTIFLDLVKAHTPYAADTLAGVLEALPRPAPRAQATLVWARSDLKSIINGGLNEDRLPWVWTWIYASQSCAPTRQQREDDGLWLWERAAAGDPEAHARAQWALYVFRGMTELRAAYSDEGYVHSYYGRVFGRKVIAVCDNLNAWPVFTALADRHEAGESWDVLEVEAAADMPPYWRRICDSRAASS